MPCFSIVARDVEETLVDFSCREGALFQSAEWGMMPAFLAKTAQ